MYRPIHPLIYPLTLTNNRFKSRPFLGASEKLREVTMSFFMSVCPSVRLPTLPPGWNNTTPTGRIFANYVIHNYVTMMQFNKTLKTDFHEDCFILLFNFSKSIEKIHLTLFPKICTENPSHVIFQNMYIKSISHYFPKSVQKIHLTLFSKICTENPLLSENSSYFTWRLIFVFYHISVF
jgi:hypothetical protein